MNPPAKEKTPSRQEKQSRKTTAALRLLSVFLFLISSACPPLQERPRATDPAYAEAAAWDRAFSPSVGWTGGDVAASFAIPGDRVLWVFGDSLIGRVEDGRRVDFKLVRNSIAAHEWSRVRAERGFGPGAIEFLWGEKDGGPADWIEPLYGEGWYWPAGGAVVATGDDADSRLGMFLLEVKKVEGDDSVFGFEVIGNALAVIDNVEQPAREWKAAVVDLPYESGPRKIEWGVAALYEPAGSGEGWVYVYGVESDPSPDRGLILARAPGSRFERFEEWEFFGEDLNWSGSPSHAAILARGVAGELSVEKMEDGAGYVMVHSEPVLGDRVFVRTAARPWGPWSLPIQVYTVTEARSSEDYFTYAAKGHLALSTPGRLLVSYIVNSHDFTDLANADIYRPRFVSIPSPSAARGGTD